MGVEDTVTALAILFSFAITAVLGYILLSNFFDVFNPMMATVTGAEMADDIQARSLAPFNMIDAGMGILAAGLLIFSVVVAYLSRSSPIFAVFSILFQGFLVATGWFLSGAFSDFINSAVVAPYASHFPITVLIMSQMAMYSLILSTLIIIFIFIKPGDASVAGYGQ